MATIVGGKEIGRTDILEVDTELSPYCSAQSVNQAIHNIFTQMGRKRWQARTNGSHRWMRLHPWAIHSLINMFIGNAIVRRCLPRINALLKAAYRYSEDNYNAFGARVANHLALDTNIPPISRQFFSTLKHVIRAHRTKSDAWAKFEDNYYDAMLTVKYQEIVADVETNPRGDQANNIRDVLGGVGQSIKFQVAGLWLNRSAGTQLA